jgi:competence protein ComGC
MNNTRARSPHHNINFDDMVQPGRRKPERAFTRIELLAVCAALLLVALVMAPAAVSSKSDSERQVCFNNLRLVGRGVQTWAGDHNMQFSWRTLQGDGGTMPGTGSLKPANAWFEYFSLSNELVTPKILACPSDTGVKQARDWFEFPSALFRANAVSYPLSLDSSMDFPRTWVSADHNFPRASLGACSARVNNASQLSTFLFGGYLPWTNAVHGSLGHVLTTDGTVEFVSSNRLNELLIRTPIDDNGSAHFLPAR